MDHPVSSEFSEAIIGGRMDYKEAEKFLRRLAQSIAPHLPDWELQAEKDEMAHRAHFKQEDMGFSLSLPHPYTKLSVATWNWPTATEWDRGEPKKVTYYPWDLYDPQEANPSIGIGVTKAPEIIARDIERRFLPDYTRIYWRLQQKAEAHQAFCNAAKQTWEEACRIMGANPKQNLHYVKTGDSRSVTVENRNGSLHIETYVDLDKLKATLKALGCVGSL